MEGGICLLGKDYEFDFEFVDFKVFMRYLSGDIVYVVGCICFEIWIEDNMFGSRWFKNKCLKLWYDGCI